MISVMLFETSKHSDFHFIVFQIEDAWQDFTLVTKLIKKFKSLYGFGGRILKIIDVCMDFEPYFKVHNMVSVYYKSIILGQMTNLNMIFYVMVLVYGSVPWWISERPFRHILRLDTRTMFSHFYKPSISSTKWTYNSTLLGIFYSCFCGFWRVCNREQTKRYIWFVYLDWNIRFHEIFILSKILLIKKRD